MQYQAFSILVYCIALHCIALHYIAKLLLASVVAVVFLNLISHVLVYQLLAQTLAFPIKGTGLAMTFVTTKQLCSRVPEITSWKVSERLSAQMVVGAIQSQVAEVSFITNFITCLVSVSRFTVFFIFLSERNVLYSVSPFLRGHVKSVKK